MANSDLPAPCRNRDKCAVPSFTRKRLSASNRCWAPTWVGCSSLLQLLPECPVGCLDGTLIEIAFHVRRQAPRVKKQKVRRNIQNLGELLDHRILGWVAAVMFH